MQIMEHSHFHIMIIVQPKHSRHARPRRGHRGCGPFGDYVYVENDPAGGRFGGGAGVLPPKPAAKVAHMSSSTQAAPAH